MIQNILIPVVESSQVGEARRKAMDFASQLNFKETERGRAGIVVTEIAGNLIKHAQDGELLLRSLHVGDLNGLEILALDKGAGMENVGECLRDGFSTGGTPGTGLGSISRLADFFDIYSIPVGTAVMAHLWATPPPKNLVSLKIGAVNIPLASEQTCGDAWAVIETDTGRQLVVVADGLGHGELAFEASSAAIRVAQENSQCSPKEILELMHGSMRSTRGAAVAIAQLDFNQQSVLFAGVGNIAASIIAPESRSMVSYNGIVGYQIHKIKEFTYPFPPGATLILSSDGLATGWRIDRYNGLIVKHPSLIAGVLYRDFKRLRDDVSVVVVRQ
ncbi:SpoIIE family protein phosphatase [Chlorogloea sp. CCALA 695]|uniref:SpoIIE family protein phosphatase n=1 Tax=Chlorogloea sp. CCALA 695 TaxID=2107693 RepID=UPI000D0525D8|nr:SpoIIE family protein phosphatase [Chlorogloea sp. CCALA 695]PSB34232.1 serine/threonine protein kinase [Chlorogloea sp. CCALA 695]